MSLPPNDETPEGNVWERWIEELANGAQVLVQGERAAFIRWADNGRAEVFRFGYNDFAVVGAGELEQPPYDLPYAAPPPRVADVPVPDAAADTDTGKPPPARPGLDYADLSVLVLRSSLDGLRRRLGVTDSSFHWRDLFREPFVLVGAGVVFGSILTCWELQPPPCADWSGLVEAAACPSGAYLARSEVVRINGPAAVGTPALLHVDCRCRAAPRTDAPESRL